MKKLMYNTLQEFEEEWKNNKLLQRRKNSIDLVVNSIKKSINSNSNTAKLYEIIIKEKNISTVIALPKSQWKEALSKSVEFYRENNAVDKCIDTWKLIELL